MKILWLLKAPEFGGVRKELASILEPEDALLAFAVAGHVKVDGALVGEGVVGVSQNRLVVAAIRGVFRRHVRRVLLNVPHEEVAISWESALGGLRLHFIARGAGLKLEGVVAPLWSRETSVICGVLSGDGL